MTHTHIVVLGHTFLLLFLFLFILPSACPRKSYSSPANSPFIFSAFALFTSSLSSLSLLLYFSFVSSYSFLTSHYTTISHKSAQLYLFQNFFPCLSLSSPTNYNCPLTSQLQNQCSDSCRDRNDLDVSAVYHQLLDTYKSSDTESDVEAKPGPSSSRNATNLGTSTRKYREQRKCRLNQRTAASAITTDWRRDCRDLLEMLWSCEDSTPFRLALTPNSYHSTIIKYFRSLLCS